MTTLGANFIFVNATCKGSEDGIILSIIICTEVTNFAPYGASVLCFLLISSFSKRPAKVHPVRSGKGQQSSDGSPLFVLPVISLFFPLHFYFI